MQKISERPSRAVRASALPDQPPAAPAATDAPLARFATPRLRDAMPSPRFVAVILLAAVLLGIALACAFGADSPPPPPGMVYVPAGEFTMGSNDGNFDERPAHRVTLSAYFIDRHEVTVDEFNAYVRATDRFESIEGPWFRVSTAACIDLLTRYEQRYGTTLASFHPADPADKAAAEKITRDALEWKAVVAALRVLLGKDHVLADGRVADLAASPVVNTLVTREAQLPVTFVTWRDAAGYAHWAGKRLPTEAEWEKAARGADARTYPWGNDWDPARARAGLDVDAGPCAVGSFPQGASPYGCVDMAGNVWEWCDDWFGEFYYQECASGVTNPPGPKGLPNGELPAPDPSANYLRNAAKQGRETDTRKVVRGGCWAAGMSGQTEFNNRCARRMWSNPDYWSQDTGFRCVMTPP